jgi:hypothetical protein
MRTNPAALAVALAGALWLVPTEVSAEKILLLGSGDTNNESTIASALDAQGDTVTVGPAFNNFTGAGVSSSTYNVVMLLPNGGFTSNNSFLAGDMPVSGQQALLNFVNAGGGLVTSEYLMEKYVAQKDFQTLYPAIPVEPSNISTSNTSIAFAPLTSNPVINAGLPSSLTFQTASGSTTEAYYLPKQGATTFFSTNQWTNTFGGEGTAYGVVGWSYGQGRVISFSTALDSTSLANIKVDQLVNNAVNWAGDVNSTGNINPPIFGGNPPIGGSGGSGGSGSIPEPATALAWSAGLFAIFVSAQSRRRAARTSRAQST